MQINKVILCGRIINPEKHTQFFQSISSPNNNVLSHLPEDNNIIYIGKENSNPFSGDVDINEVIACRFIDRNACKQFRIIFKEGMCVYIVGHLSSDVEKNCHNSVVIDYYKKANNHSSQCNVALISGETIDKKGPFITVKVGNNYIDLYNNVDLNIKCVVSLTSYIRLSNTIGKSNKNVYADNVISVSDDDIYNDYSISEYNKSKFSPEKFISVLKKFNDTELPNESESDLISNILNVNNLANLNYDLSDIINFHIAMKNNGLVILAGPSGTGKTALVRSYAGALGLLNPKNDNIQYLHISVSPSWTDDNDLLGYYDAENSVYHPSNTGLVNLLINASSPCNRHKLYIVLLDEMNLSHIEYYFSQFLSILELPEGDNNRCIRLFGNKNNEVYKDDNGVPSSIPIYDNVLFVGTINIDESTKNITDKVLDRSNLITMNSGKFDSDLFKSKNTNELKQLLKSIQPITVDKFNLFKGENSSNSLLNGGIANNRLKLLNDLNSAFKDATYKRLEIGYRVVKQINEYLCDIPNDSSIPDENPKEFTEKLFDRQLCQRIFDKLNGDKFHLYKLILLLDASLYDNQDEKQKLSALSKASTLINDSDTLTKDFKNIKEYGYSKEIIHHKLMELDHYGFTE